MAGRDREPRRAGTGLQGIVDRFARLGVDPAVIGVPERSAVPQPNNRDALELAASRIPPRFHDATADDPQVLAWVEHVKQAARRGPEGQLGIARASSLLLLGETGTGKTHQAYGAIRSLLGAGVRLRWQAITSVGLHAMMRPRPGADAEREMRDLERTPLLLVDDLGAGRASEFTEETTYRLINHRYEQQLPTIITSNITPAELAGLLGDRTASRLRQMCHKAVLAGPDRRRAPLF
ncbi:MULTISPECIES: ATP-binding protein [unclassified Kitasatospora]|uniref:ATP-binding protein n=1 Tax=unclassified Kitasatospora TaxID=2633591 RepID=UPI001EEA14E6|nr:ATP-binding protein [Kitasatospora sp. A2-31]MCG6496928.1 ATP-binding protein [Kitasatospora sp. A2-31]